MAGVIGGSYTTAIITGSGSYTTNAWEYWNTGGSGATTISVSTDGIWTNWLTVGPVRCEESDLRTEAERQQAAEALRAQQEAIRVAREKRDAAVARAEKLLRQNLSDSQVADLEKTGSFIQVSRGKSYRIHRVMAGGIQELDAQGNAVARYCIHAEDTQVPLADNMLAWVLMLRFAPEEFHKKANKTLLRAA